ncbi:protein mono-ADP-ribosyltransferase PARP4 isoform X1 [Perognathus longimembris pacificus]|uniref:protein mono-ADP-ribosyltransferase PARP4 isoform X1 n=1 Tax=Perognathus longimembris pacificus TaxID=214514 RepID=UPI002018C1DC|nr:protein mono-ADP-ribosyltransferase PARP4 isoform X1 [Perognathus longimembris pacificus]
MTVGIFANCVFCLKVKYLPRQQKKKLQADIKENGGKVSFLLSLQCTHIILDNADTLSQYQLDSLQKNHILIASPDFIWESIRERKLLDIKTYNLNKSLPVTPPPHQNSSSELKTDAVSLENDPEEENTELTEFYEKNVAIPHFPQDFEVAKYNTLDKVGPDGGQEVVVVELRCSQDSGRSPFMITAHFLLAGDMQTRKECMVKETPAEASEYYESYIEDLKKQGFLLREHFTPEATQLASEKVQALLLEEVISSSTLSPEVSELVELFWAETVGHLEHTLLKPVNTISLNDVSKAEGTLLLVRTALKKGETIEELQKMMAEFYRLIPHRHPETEEVNLRLLAKKEDLCQLVRDMVNVCETHLSRPNLPSFAKYQALRCKIEHVEQNTEEFSRVEKEVLQTHCSESPGDILQIFRIGRVNEATEFLSKLGNVKPLLHGSPVQNFVGILSRGLLLPKVVEDHGVQRTDIGNLGSGIYFSNSLSSSSKYAHPGSTDGSRFLLICDVALGKCLDLTRKNFSLTEAPQGYDSVHGVSEAASVPTDFEDDEFVVYKTNQIKMKYLIKFRLPGDQIKDFHPHINTDLEEFRPEDLICSNIEDYQLPDSKRPSDGKAGLQDSGGCPVPLEEVHIKGRVIDFVAQVIVFQTYTNQSHVPIEAKYIFPLDDKAAVCGFEAFINEKHVVGEIKEKEEAQREYREAIREGHGAYLMDQDAPDVFTVSVGNLPPKAKVLIKITYITELSIQGPVAVFFMPATVAPWQQHKALNENLQDTVEKVYIKEIGAKQSFSLALSIEMPYVIQFISSDTHKLKQKSTDCKAIIRTVEGSSLGSDGFSLHIGLCDAYLPRMWVEKHPEKESEACMLVFQPDLDATLPGRADKNEVIICLDCSNSMKGVAFMEAKQIALHALSLVDKGQRVNIIQFGTGYKELFSYPKFITSNEVPTKFIMSATPTMGNTDLYKMLRYLSLLRPSQGMRNVLLLSDGHLQNESLTVQLVKRNVHHTRLFTCGVGSTANRYVLRTLSQCGAGVFEYFNSKSKHSWKKQITDQMIRLRAPSCHSISIKWQQFSLDSAELLQAPARVRSLFHNDRLLVYGFIPHCTQATLCALIQEKEYCTMVSTTELQKTTGTMIHKLAAQALIRDYEDGILHDNETGHEMKKQTMKSLIIKLSKENSLITQFTSFVAVEKRDDKESPFPSSPNISELIAKEDIDFLPYMTWQEELPETANTAQIATSLEVLQDGSMDDISLLQPRSLSFEWNEELQHTHSWEMKRMQEADCLLEYQPCSVRFLSGDLEESLDLSQKDSRRQKRSKLETTYSSPCASVTPASLPLPSLLKDTHSLFHPGAAVSPAVPPVGGPGLEPGTSPSIALGSAPPRPPPDFLLGTFDSTFSGDSLNAKQLKQKVSYHMGKRPKCGRSSLLDQAPEPAFPPMLFPPPKLPVPHSSFPFGHAQSDSSLQDQNCPVSMAAYSRDFRNLHRQQFLVSGSAQKDTGLTAGQEKTPKMYFPTKSLHHGERGPESGSQSIPFSGGLGPESGFQGIPFSGGLGPESSFQGIPFRGGLGPESGFQGIPLRMGPESVIQIPHSGGMGPETGFQGILHSGRVQPASVIRKTLHCGRIEPASVIRRTPRSGSLEPESVIEKSPLSDRMEPESVFHRIPCSGKMEPASGLQRILHSGIEPRSDFWIHRPLSVLFALQTEHGYWKLIPELGLIVNLKIHVLHNYLEEKGIRSLGTKGKECLLHLIATLLALQYIRRRMMGIAFKPLMKLDEAFRDNPWNFEKVKKAIEWVRRIEGQYSSICQRLELGKDWDSATKQLLGLEPLAASSPLSRVLQYAQGC